MARRTFIQWPDKRLRAPAEPVQEITKDIGAIWNDMIETMDAMPGYGLAAPQIGVMLRLAVVDCSEERGKAIRLANPELIAESEEASSWEEASPNLPGVSARVTRPAEVTVSYVDESEKLVERQFEGLWATSIQHQIDHLDGRLYFDRLSRTKREMLLKKARKVAQ
ncbi:MAG: peptide deformylase [Boseongicola sp.]